MLLRQWQTAAVVEHLGISTAKNPTVLYGRRKEEKESFFVSDVQFKHYFLKIETWLLGVTWNANISPMLYDKKC